MILCRQFVHSPAWDRLLPVQRIALRQYAAHDSFAAAFRLCFRLIGEPSRDDRDLDRAMADWCDARARHLRAKHGKDVAACRAAHDAFDAACVALADALVLRFEGDLRAIRRTDSESIGSIQDPSRLLGMPNLYPRPETLPAEAVFLGRWKHSALWYDMYAVGNHALFVADGADGMGSVFRTVAEMRRYQKPYWNVAADMLAAHNKKQQEMGK